jgi:hypothetical protein
VRVGLVTWWFNRGQATVMRTMRAALDEAGHDTYVLARPTDPEFERSDYVAEDGVWAQPRVTRASRADIPAEEYVSWAAAHRLDAVLLFQNFDVEGIGALRAAGVATAGTYMWEAFGPEDAAQVAPVLDRVFALNRPSADRYRDLGLDVGEAIPFAMHPDFGASAVVDARPPGGVRFMFAAGYLRARKPLGAVVEAFVRGAAPDATLTIKSQVPIRAGDLIRPTTTREVTTRYETNPGGLDELGPGDPRIAVVSDDLDEPDFVAQLRAHDVVVGVSRWEGLGLHLYECEALGVPLVLNRMEPFVDHARLGGRCLLVDSKVIGRRKQGIDVHEPDVASLAAAFARLSSPAAIAERFGEPGSSPERWEGFVGAIDRLVSQLPVR